MYLCHKCGGLLCHEKSEDVKGLLDCQCMSGYYRGSEPKLSRAEAIDAQIKAQEDWLHLYKRQGRSERDILPVQQKIEKLLVLKGEQHV